MDHRAPHRRRQRQCPSPPGAVKTAGQSPWTSPSLGKCTLLIPLPTGMILSFISRGHWRDIAGGWRGSFWSCWPDSCSEVSSFHSYPAPGVNRGTYTARASHNTPVWQFGNCASSEIPAPGTAFPGTWKTYFQQGLSSRPHSNPSAILGAMATLSVRDLGLSSGEAGSSLVTGPQP